MADKRKVGTGEGLILPRTEKENLRLHRRLFRSLFTRRLFYLGELGSPTRHVCICSWIHRFILNLKVHLKP